MRQEDSEDYSETPQGEAEHQNDGTYEMDLSPPKSEGVALKCKCDRTREPVNSWHYIEAEPEEIMMRPDLGVKMQKSEPLHQQQQPSNKTEINYSVEHLETLNKMKTAASEF